MRSTPPAGTRSIAGPDEWVRPRPDRAQLRADAALALGLAALSVLTSLLSRRIGVYPDPAEPWLWAVGLAATTLPLAARRLAPVPTAVCVAIGFFVCGQFQVPETLVINISLFIALYSVGAWEQRRVLGLWTRIGIAGAMIAWLSVSLVLSASDPDAYRDFSRSGVFSQLASFAALQILTNLLYFSGAFLFGENSWRAARAATLLETRGSELELERRTSAAQAVALDRLRIARELHDVVAHHVSVMGIQAAAARRSLGDADHPATSALAAVEESARSAVSELHGLLHTLRAPDGDAAASTASVARLPELIADSARAGTPATLVVVGEPRPVPMLVDVALFRTAQEALTNVRKHAGRGATAQVRLRFTESFAEVEISDDGVAGPGRRAVGPGLGLRGMRERVGAVGGSIEAGPRERGGFLVRAQVPITGARA